MKKLLIHTCCAPCATFPFEKLTNNGYSPASFFYNPNIHPQEEYKRRLEELFRFTELMNYPLIVKEDDPVLWLNTVKGFETAKEGGKRCEICFRMRLEKTAIYAKENSFDGFTTVMTVSPHKNSTVINQIGKELEEKYNIFFLEENFKKNEGFKKSFELSKKYNLYRQKYCGCAFSLRNG